MRVQKRQKPLKLWGGPGTRDWLQALLDLAYPGSFAPEKCYRLDWVTLEPGRTYEVFGIEAAVAPTQHRVPNVAIRLSEAGRHVAYSGDGLPTPQALELYEGVDLLVHECHALREDTSSHASLPTVVKATRQARVKTIGLVHQRPEERAAINATAQQLLTESVDTAVGLWCPESGDRVEIAANGEAFRVAPDGTRAPILPKSSGVLRAERVGRRDLASSGAQWSAGLAQPRRAPTGG
jgi:hypothetical protein